MLAELIKILDEAEAGLDHLQLAEALWLAQFAPRVEVPPAQSLAPEREEAAEQPNPNKTTEKHSPQPQPKPQQTKKLYAGKPETGAATVPARAVPVPDVSPLSDALEIGRAMRPLRRRTASRWEVRLDEAATAEASAEASSLRFTNVVPVMRPAMVRWFVLELIVEQSTSMVVWQDVALELRRLMEHTGAFSDVRLWTLFRRNGQAQLRDAAGREHSPRQICDSANRRLMMIFSDGSSRGWIDGSYARAITEWSENSTVVLLQPLCERLWNRTLVGEAANEITSPEPGAANAKLKKSLFWSDDPENGRIALPVTSLKPEMIERWARMVALPGNGFRAAMLATSLQTGMSQLIPEQPPEPSSTEPDKTVSATEIVQAFRTMASDEAFDLAVYLSLMPLTPEIMRVTQWAMFRAPQLEHLSEFLLGGLLSARIGEQPDGVFYPYFDFRPGVREELLPAIRRSEIEHLVRNAVSDLIGQHIGSVREFIALILDPKGKERLPVDESYAQFFAEITLPALRQLGYEFDSSDFENDYLMPLPSMSPKLIVRAGPAKGLVYEIKKPVIVIGGQEFNSPDTLAIKDRMVSRKHCQITHDGNAYRLYDLGSKNGTFINGSPVKEAELRHKDEIRIGETWLLFLLHEEDNMDLESARVRFLDDDLLTQSTVLLRSEDSFYLKNPKPSHSWELAGRAERNYEMLSQLGREIDTIRSSIELQQRLLELIFTVIPAERGVIMMTAPGEGEFASRVVRYRHEQIQGQELIISRTILRQAKKEDGGILTVCVNLEASPDTQKSLVTSGAKSVLAARLAIASEIFGIIYLDTTNPGIQFDEDDLQLLIAIANRAAGALETARYVERLNSDKKRLQDELDDDRKMIGGSAQIKAVRERIAKVAPTDASVLIRGESGTGKELVALAIHQNSERKDKPFIAINCATLPDHLIESELFGYERGAFTGATSRKLGRFEMADGGTIFLDEIGELKPELQAKLLRVLQESEIERLGGTQPIKVNVRLVAATNKDLETAMQSGSFREDLFFRLNVMTIKIPTLRERADDIQQLANYFASKYAAKYKRRIRGISQPARECLQRYGWQGNVRELENAIEHAVILAATDLILPEDLPEKVLAGEPESDKTSQPMEADAITQPDVEASITNFHKAVNAAKKRILRTALKQAKNNRTEAARLLGLHPNNFDRLMRQHNLRSADLLQSEQETYNTDTGSKHAPQPETQHPATQITTLSFHKAVNEARKRIILDAIEQSDGDRVAAAQLLGLHPNNLSRLIRQHDLRNALKNNDRTSDSE